MFIAGVIFVPWVVVRIPADYFAHRKRQRTPWDDQHPIVRAILIVLKNVIGIAFLALGILMLVLPGQGVLTMLVGLMLIDFPGKYKLERYIVTRRPVLNTINWLRQRRGEPPLAITEHDN